VLFRLTATSPLPDNDAVWGLFVALSVTVSVPVNIAVAVGVNVTLMVQWALAASELPQVLVCAKFPDVAIEEMLMEVARLFVRVKAWAEVVVEMT